MAFDGVTISCLVKELNEVLPGGRISKISQPEEDELLITVKTAQGQRRLLISAGASLPLIYLTQDNKPGPMEAPGFCMLLRKHLQNGRIVGISQPGLERIVNIDVEHSDEMGDLVRKRLVVEIMGKHSNIILCDENDVIIDSIKHISAAVSSVRQVLPGRSYFVVKTQEKADALNTDRGEFYKLIGEKQSMSVFKAVYNSYTGLSPLLSQEICYRAHIDADLPVTALCGENLHSLYESFDQIIGVVKKREFTPVIACTDSKPVEFAAVYLSMYENGADHLEEYSSMSNLLEDYYSRREAVTRIRQRSADLRRIVSTALERNVKKYDLQMKQMEDTKKRDTYRIYGELLNTYGYDIPEGSTSFSAVNYYNGETVTIPLDPTMSAQENAQKYFEKYNKLKRTYEALSQLTQEVHDEILHLESVSTSLDIALKEEDLVQIRQELVQSGYIRKKSGAKKEKVTSKPFHYVSSDGFDIYVGKNNFQNDELTFHFAAGEDWWFHAKNIPGSHVVLKTQADTSVPVSTFEDAARLAAYYSRGKDQDKVEVDYTQKKYVKKPNSSKPGFVIYHTNYSMMIDTDISGIKRTG